VESRCARGLPALVHLLANLPAWRNWALTTNGVLLADQAEALARAGLRRVNVSLDAMNPARFAAITQGGDVRRVWRDPRCPCRPAWNR